MQLILREKVGNILHAVEYSGSRVLKCCAKMYAMI